MSERPSAGIASTVSSLTWLKQSFTELGMEVLWTGCWRGRANERMKAFAISTFRIQHDDRLEMI